MLFLNKTKSFISTKEQPIITMVEEDFQEVSELDLLYEAHDKLDVLIELLAEKGIISLEEYNEKLEEYLDNLENEDFEDSEDEEED